MTTTDDQSDSLLGALSKARIPVENHGFIERLTMAVGIAEYQAVVSVDKPYVRARRQDGLPDLRIHYGYTTGFVSEDEVVRVAGSGADRGPSSRKGTWYVAHPTNQVRHGSDRARDIRREAARLCTTCYVQLPLTGICGACD
ncbi:hypothetical protein [Mycolicibacter sinensis]|uniref:Uncharacterized protein n=1 Tax=Mycolicibacter sinensis (strain JDM601) TaxID=875328 RepID=A0A1A2EL53_MYCSD|nr:hypothetical protein [Mycolicibacter sinensis]OBG06223.1 hypothetical protein A5771_08670 [Mycolicibacter sinensis]OBG07035.1 hypothetical protein A5772_20390 [Mycolicibacter sinensis]